MRLLLDLLFPPRADEIIVRKIVDDEFLALVAPRLVPTTHPEVVSLLPLNDPCVRGAIHEAKYHGNTRAFDLLALALSEYLSDCEDMGCTTSHIFLVPVPLGKKREKERGFNQVEEIAKRAGKRLDIAVDTELLIRTRETVSQVSLPRERRVENMRNAFGIAHVPDPLCTYVVVDDVTTTGATLQAAIDTLTNAGATHIIPLALAH